MMINALNPTRHCERSMAIPNCTERKYRAYTRSWLREGQSLFLDEK